MNSFTTHPILHMLRKMAPVLLCGMPGMSESQAIETATLVWTYEGLGTVFGAPAIGPNGEIVNATDDNEYAVTDRGVNMANKGVEMQQHSSYGNMLAAATDLNSLEFLRIESGLPLKQARAAVEDESVRVEEVTTTQEDECDAETNAVALPATARETPPGTSADHAQITPSNSNEYHMIWN